VSESSVSATLIFFKNYPQCKNCCGNPPGTPAWDVTMKIGCTRSVEYCHDREKRLCPKCPRKGRTTLEDF